MRGKVIFLDSVHEVLAERLTLAGYECIMATSDSREICLQKSEDAIGLVIRSRFRMDASFLESCKKLKFIARSGAGMENIDEDYCAKRKITLFNAPEGNRNAVGEHALAMILALFNKIHTADRDMRKGLWQREENRGIELDGKTVGIIGFGNNGSAFARKLQGFDVKILAYDKYRSGFAFGNVQEATWNQIMEEADILSLHVPLTKETDYLMNSDRINKFRKPFYLVNCARGRVVKTDDLVLAMKQGAILGACLDVLEYEKASFESFETNAIPGALDYLMSSDQVVFSPHVAGWTHESYFKLSNVLADKILAASHL